MFILLIQEDGDDFPVLFGEYETFEEADFERMYHQPDLSNILKIHEVDGIEKCHTFTEENEDE